MHIGPYRVLRVLARGGMGEVCLASLERPGGFRKLVALKRALPEFAADPAFSTMFQREARLAAALNHRNIVQVFDFAHHGDEAWLAMEYVRGVDLKAVLDAERLPLGLTITIGMACARALDYVHRAVDAQGQPLHLVHQDVSPANVLLSYEGDIKLSDFGVAWQGDAAQRGMEGKLGYMSPEAVQGVRLDARADQFALGTVLYEMFSGARAFWATDGSTAILARVRSATPLQPLCMAAPALGSALRAVVERAMAADPADRFEDVGALAQALDDAATPVDRSARLGPWLAERFPEVDAPYEAPIEVTAAAAAPIAALPIAARHTPEPTIAATPSATAEPTAAAVRPIVTDPSRLAPDLSEPHRRTGLVWLLTIAIVSGAAFAFWPESTSAPTANDAALVDASTVDATLVDASLADARPLDAQSAPDARVVDAAPLSDAAPPIDAQPPTASPRSRAPRSRAPRSRAPRSRAPRSRAPRSRAPRSRAPRSVAPRTVASVASVASIVIAPMTAPVTAAPVTTAPAAPATLAPLRGPRIRARGARITAGQLIRDGWHQVFEGGAFLRFTGPGPSLSLRVKPQSGRFLATITSKPFAPLRVDDRPLGSTPAAMVPLSAGRHVIEVGVAPEITRLIIEIGG